MNITTITKALSLLGQPVDKRTTLAFLIQGTGAWFDDETVTQMMRHYTELGPDPIQRIVDAIGDGSWVELSHDLRREASQHNLDEAEQNRMERDTSSSIHNVSSDNPYGWSKPDRKRAQDHNIPGQWNPYRQSFNLEIGQKQQIGAPDYRRRGCSRIDVLGFTESMKGWRPGKGLPPPPKNEKAAKVAYDPMEVSMACAKDYGDVSDEKVYGE